MPVYQAPLTVNPRPGRCQISARMPIGKVWRSWRSSRRMGVVRRKTALFFRSVFPFARNRIPNFSFQRYHDWGCDLLSDFLTLRDIHNTEEHSSNRILLWFAFRFFNFTGYTQPPRLFLATSPCCDLLSDFLTLRDIHNRISIVELSPRLWFAFRFFNFTGYTQRKLYM